MEAYSLRASNGGSPTSTSIESIDEGKDMFTLVVPVFNNEGSIPELIQTVSVLNQSLSGNLDAVFVDDGSPDRSRELLEKHLPGAGYRARIVILSRNFGSFAAIRAGLGVGAGDYFAVMAADLQEPLELVLRFHEVLMTGTCDVVVGTRESRCDPLATRIASNLFWGAYRLFAQRNVPPGGVDVFGCTRRFRDEILALPENNSTLVGLIFWLGFRRAEVRYARRARRHGASGWGFKRKVRYLLDSTFAFGDLPIRVLSLVGIMGMSASALLASVVLAARTFGNVTVPGYTATVLVVMFFGGLNSLGLGIVGEYVWRAFENTKKRPGHIIVRTVDYGGNGK